jgi:hypothetical protein
MGNDNIRLWFPSVLKSIDILQREEPTEIYISTPGPIGLLGLLVSRLLNIKALGIYEPDFTEEIGRAVEDKAIIEILESYARWFYSKMDMIKVHTSECKRSLEAKGLKKDKLQLIPKDIEAELFVKKPDEEQIISNINRV